MTYGNEVLQLGICRESPVDFVIIILGELSHLPPRRLRAGKAREKYIDILVSCLVEDELEGLIYESLVSRRAHADATMVRENRQTAASPRQRE